MHNGLKLLVGKQQQRRAQIKRAEHMTDQSDKTDLQAIARRELRIREKAYQLWE
jgi:hypothetical protein